MEASDAEHIRILHDRGLGQIVLNRGQSLNALSLGMIKQMRSSLNDFARDGDVKAVLIRSKSDKAFCAGGDIKAVGLEAQKMQREKIPSNLCQEIFQQEYLLNSEIYAFGKPCASFIDGLCMGGGMGISMHGSHVVVSEKTVFSMPEVFIGFFPDVGSGYLFNRLSMSMARYILLTGVRLNGPDLVWLNLANYYLESAAMHAVQKTLIGSVWHRSDPVALLNAELTTYAEGVDMPESVLIQKEDEIESLFAGDDLNEILYRIQNSTGVVAQEARQALAKACPLSVRITFDHMNWARGQDFDVIMQNEYRLSQFFMMQPDFYEGIRAALIDKDKNPEWQKSYEDFPENIYMDVQEKYEDLSLEG